MSVHAAAQTGCAYGGERRRSSAHWTKSRTTGGAANVLRKLPCSNNVGPVLDAGADVVNPLERPHGHPRVVPVLGPQPVHVGPGTLFLCLAVQQPQRTADDVADLLTLATVGFNDMAAELMVCVRHVCAYRNFLRQIRPRGTSEGLSQGMLPGLLAHHQWSDHTILPAENLADQTIRTASHVAIGSQRDIAQRGAVSHTISHPPVPRGELCARVPRTGEPHVHAHRAAVRVDLTIRGCVSTCPAKPSGFRTSYVGPGNDPPT